MSENATNLINATVCASEGFLGFLSDYYQELFVVITIIGLVFKRYSQKKQHEHEHEKEMERMQQENHLRALLIELKSNKETAEKDERYYYQYLAYKTAKGTGYLEGISEDLRVEIDAAYNIISAFCRQPNDVNFPKKIPELEKLLEGVIPKLEEYLKTL